MALSEKHSPSRFLRQMSQFKYGKNSEALIFCRPSSIFRMFWTAEVVHENVRVSASCFQKP